jgi:hypothetical protein
MQTEPRVNPRSAYSYKQDPAVPAFPDDRPIIIFDGYCVLCSRFAQFVLRHDRRAVFRLLAAQSSLGQAIFRHLGLDPVSFQTYVLRHRIPVPGLHIYRAAVFRGR